MNLPKATPKQKLPELLNHQAQQPRALAFPLSLFKMVWRKISRKVPVRLVPLMQLQQNGHMWQATGADAQFVMVTDCSWSQCAGWYWLTLDCTANAPLPVRLFFDLDQEFAEPLVLHCRLSRHEEKAIPLFIPPHCRAIRLAPCDGPTRFTLSAKSMERIHGAPELQGCFLDQKNVYEQLGWREGNGANLVPENGIKPINTEYSWQTVEPGSSFYIKNLRLDCRWYMIEMRLRSETSIGNAAFFFNDGQNEPVRLELPFHSGLTMKRLYKPDTPPQHVRIVPLDQPGAFSMERLHFAPVPTFFAYNRMLRRLRNCIPRYRNWKLATIWWDILQQARTLQTKTVSLLLRQYNATFPAHYEQGTYENWIARVEQPEYANLGAIHLSQKKFRVRPLVLLILVINHENDRWLQESIESIRQQSYSQWQLRLVLQEDISPQMRQTLEEMVHQDNRISFSPRGFTNGCEKTSDVPITGAYDWLAILDTGGLLAPHTLHFVVQAIKEHPDTRIIYSDEDRIDEQGQRTEPRFKPDWNPDLFFSHNYIHRMCVYHRSLVEQAGGIRNEGDYARLLHCLPYVQENEIIRIPRILYHDRSMIGQDTSTSVSAVNIVEDELKALRRYFTTQGKKDVQIEPGILPNTYRIRYPIPYPPPLVSLIVPTRNMLEVLEPCLRSILDKTQYSYYEIIVVDNESDDPATLAYLDRLQLNEDRVRILSFPHPFNYSSINNFAVAKAKGDIIGLVNNDIEVISPDWLAEMVSHALRPEIGCVGAKLYYADETIQHGGVILGLGGVAGHAHRYFPRQSTGYCNRLQVVQNLSAVTAACLVVRKSVYLEVGGLEEKKLQVAFNDVDFCIKVREAGYRNLWTPYAELFHHESKSRGMDDTPEKQARFQREFKFMQDKWGRLLQQDPSYSPNLTFCYEDFSIG